MRLRALTGFAVGLLFSALYGSTLAPGVLYYDQVTQDSPALQAMVPNLGISHPTGYPTYMMLSHLFTYVPVGEVAYRVNLASAVFGVVAVILVYLVGLALSGNSLAAAAGAVAFGVGPTFWVQAIIAEVYTLNAAFVALVILALFVWRERRRDAYLLVCALLVGLSLTNHLTSGLLIPAGLLFVFLTDRKKLADRSLWLRGVGLFLLGLLPYVYLPVRSSVRLPENTADVSTLGGFASVVSGGPFKGWMFSFGPAELPGRFLMYLGHCFQQFPFPLLLASSVGAAFMLRRDVAGSTLLGIVFLGSLIYALEYAVSDVYVFFVPTYLVIGIWLSVGIEAISRIAKDRLAGALPNGTEITATGVLALVLALLGAAGTYEEVDRSRDHLGHRMIRAVSREVEPDATVVHRRSPLLYMQMVQNRREDIDLWDWRVDHDSGEQARATEDLSRGRLYLLSPNEEVLNWFLEAGYDMAHVEGELLYRVIPPRADDPATARRGSEPPATQANPL